MATCRDRQFGERNAQRRQHGPSDRLPVYWVSAWQSGGDREDFAASSRRQIQNRDRGAPHDAAPPTPPYVRVRIRRFGELSGLLGTREGRPSAAKKAFGNAMTRAGLLLIRHGPCGLPAVGAARATLTPRFISCANLVRPRFQCFQAMARSRRLVHCSRARNTVGVSQKPK